MEDFLYKFLTIYNYFPVPIKQFLGKVYSILPGKIKYGAFYYKYLKRIQYFNNLKNSSLVKKEQEKILFDQINFAINNIPFYKNYDRCKSLDQFKKYPIINKKTIINSKPELINPDPKVKQIKANTGGSSGTPMEFFLEKNISRPKEKAHFNWYWGQYGYKPLDKMLMIRGMPLANHKIFEYRAIDNILNVSCYSVNEENILSVLHKINKFKPVYIHAYPSSLKIITLLLEKHSTKLKVFPKAIFLGSEHLLVEDRILFEEIYKTKVVNWYGHSERLIHGGNCPYSNEYHFYPSYGYLELLDENGSDITIPGKEGRIVATGFDNKAMPFIRYDTGDIGILSEKNRCKCGFQGTSLQKISGRGQDLIVLKNGTKVSLTAFIFGQHLEAFRKIRELQVIQKKIGKIELKVVKNSNYNKTDEESIYKTLLNSVNNELIINFTYTDTIPKNHRGKNIFFISNLK